MVTSSAKKTTMTLKELEELLVQKHARLEDAGDPGTAKVLDQIMKIKDMRAKQRQQAMEMDSVQVKPTVLVTPMISNYKQWQKIAADQQADLISDTQKIKFKNERISASDK